LYADPIGHKRRTVDLVVEDDLAMLAELPGWTVDGPVAEYRLSDTSWVARIRRVTVFGKAHNA
jgi:hypothetical protein